MGLEPCSWRSQVPSGQSGGDRTWVQISTPLACCVTLCSDLASLSLHFLICTMVLTIPRLGEFGNSGENNEYKARSTEMGTVVAQHRCMVGCLSSRR